MADIARKEACPKCRAEGRDSVGDNLHVFNSGVKHCIAGHGTLGVEQKAPEIVSPPTNESGFLSGEYADIRSRGINRKTCEFYGYMINREKQCHIAQYFDASGKLTLQQLRTADKQFPLIGDKSYNKTLWGAHKFTANENLFITITEGQVDALSVAQAFDCKYPVVSLPNGVAGAPDVISKNKKYLDGFKYVVLAFDNDAPGAAATETCLRLLEPGKVRVARWIKKDANEYLQENDVASIRNIVYNAVAYIPEPIITGAKLLESLEGYRCKTQEWPWAQAKVIQPIRIPALYTIAARPKIGKTEFVAEIMRAEIGNGGKIGVIALEQTIQQVLVKLTDTLTGSDLSSILNREYTQAEKELCSQVAEKLVIYDHTTYGSDLQTVVDNVPYMIKSLGCQLVVFDNLSYAATSIPGDERRAIDQAMIKLKNSTIKYNYTLLNVVHLKREENTMISSDNECPVSVEGIRGSGGIEMYSDYIIGLHRDKSSDNVKIRNTLTAYVLADRMSGQDTGKSFSMRYDPKTRRLF